MLITNYLGFMKKIMFKTFKTTGSAFDILF